MKNQEVIDLYEAYQSIYSQQEINEEVEIAAHYFYEMGLNEEGVEILIEELGVKEFTDFVYDIAEEYVLTEARRGPGGTKVKIEPVTSKGTSYKGGKPNASGLKRLRAEKQKRKESEEKTSNEKPSGMKASLKRQDAIAAASKKQPQKKGLLDRVAGAVLKGIERHNAAMSSARETGNVAGKAAKTLGKGLKTAASEFAGGVRTAGKAAKDVHKALTAEELEAWVNELVNEGYDLSEYTWDEMAEIYMEEVEQLDEARRADKLKHKRGTAANPDREDVPHNDPSQRTNLHSRLKRRADEMGRERRNSPRYRQGGRPPLSKKEKAFLQASDRTSPGRGHVRNPNVPDTGSHAQWPSERGAQRDPKQNPRHNANKQTAAEEYDVFDCILDHLISEGYADDVDSALVIMSNMSEEWRESIVEANVVAQQGGVPGRVQVRPVQQGGIRIGPVRLGTTTVNRPVPGTFKAGGISDKDAARYNNRIDNTDISAAQRQHELEMRRHSGFIPLSNPSSIPDTGIPGRPSPGRAEDQTRARTKGY